MRQSISSRACFRAPVGAFVVLAAGCGGVDDSRGNDSTDSSGTVRAESDTLRYWHQRPGRSGAGGATAAAGGAPAANGGAATGGTATGGAATAGGGTTSSVDCSICTTALQCCDAVSAGALCTFSAEECSSLDAGRQATYALYCLTVLRTTISAWNIAGRTPPAACILP